MIDCTICTMPTIRLRKRLLDRLVKSAGGAGEIGLALLMTAGVTHCGGSGQSKTGEGVGDGAADHGLAVEAAQEAGPGIEAAGGDGSPNPMVEAAVFPDAGTDGHLLPEASPPPQDAGSDAAGPIIEAATPAPDAGTDAHHAPVIEAMN
jgi:hypothetical protein